MYVSFLIKSSWKDIKRCKITTIWMKERGGLSRTDHRHKDTYRRIIDRREEFDKQQRNTKRGCGAEEAGSWEPRRREKLWKRNYSSENKQFLIHFQSLSKKLVGLQSSHSVWNNRKRGQKTFKSRRKQSLFKRSVQQFDCVSLFD